MSTLSALVLLSALTAADDAVLVQFSSDNCGACRTMQPIVARLADAGYPVQTVNIDQQPEYARQFRIQGVPTYVLMVKGRETDRAMGATGYDKLVQMFQGIQPNPVAQTATVVRGQSPELTPVGPVPAETSARGTYENQAAAASQSSSAAQLALQASVRLKVEDASGFGFGTGTVIDVHGEEALVVTCGHLFRVSEGKGTISIDLFAPGATESVAGQLLAYDLKRDIALVSMRPSVKITPMQVAPEGQVVRPRDGVFTIGCDKGANPTVRESQVTAVNKYQGPPNFTVAGQPCDGRSGGGLFTADGLLIGICNAADPQDDEGIYAALGSIHWQLDQLQLAEIYRRGGVTPVAAPPQLAAVPSLPAQMPSRQLEPVAAATAPAATQSSTPDGDSEVIVIVRSRSNPQRPGEVFTLNGAPPELLAKIAAHAGRGADVRAASFDSSRMAQRDRVGAELPVIRGQSAE